jgi:cyclic di-GMP phosphodiesterase Gmr
MPEALVMIVLTITAAAWWNLFLQVVRRREHPTMSALAWVAIVFALWSTLSLVQEHTGDPASRALLLRAMAFVALIAPAAWWLLSLRLAAPSWLKRWHLAAFAVPSAASAIGAALWPLGGPFLQNVSGRQVGRRLALDWDVGPALVWFGLPYAYALLLAAIVCVLYLGLAARRLELRTSLALAAAMVLPVIGTVLQITGLNPLATYDVTGILLGPSVALLYLVVAYSERFDVRAVAYGEVFAAIAEPVLIASSDGKVMDVNPAMRRLLEIDAEIEGVPLALVEPQFAALRCDGDPQRPLSSLSGRFHGYAPSLSAVRNRRGRQVACVLLLRDVRASMEREAALRDAAHRDPLTAVGNRLGFEAALTSALRDPPPAGFGIVFIDLDGFKPINDQHGHLVGDAVLVEIAKRLSGLVRSGDVAARLGGDEFVVLMRNPRREDLGALAARIEGAITMPFRHEGRTLRVGASTGVARAPADGKSMDDLLRVADARMYRHKRTRTDPGTRP